MSLQPGPVPPRHQPTAALLLLSGLRHQTVGPALQSVCVCSAEPLQRCHLSQLQLRRRHHDQVLPAKMDEAAELWLLCGFQMF